MLSTSQSQSPLSVASVSESYGAVFITRLIEPSYASALDTARAYWTLLISQGSKGRALKAKTEDEDVDMMGAGWQDQYTQWWFDFLNEKGARGVSRDTWVMVRLPFPEKQSIFDKLVSVSRVHSRYRRQFRELRHGR